MPTISDDELKKYKSKYKKMLEKGLGQEPEPGGKSIDSTEYRDFVEELRPHKPNWYEKACRLSERLLKIKPDPKKEEGLLEAIATAHLDITPTGAYSFSYLFPIVIIVFGGLLGYVIFDSMFIMGFFLLGGVSVIIPIAKMPHYFAASYRMKASNQMVQCIFYIVTYMRHTSNLEKAIEFSASHLLPPLSLDLKKVIWDVETEKYESIRESLNSYLHRWRKYNMEFVEAFHLIESSLYESSEERRISLLDKSLDVMLEETYEKMLHYAQNLKSPITTLHMLGIIMPILGLVILPLIVSFMSEVSWYHISLLYNVALPLMVYFMGKNILINRPTGYGDTEIQASDAEAEGVDITLGGNAKKKASPLNASVAILIILLVVGFSPLIIHALSPGLDYSFMGFYLLEYKPSLNNPDIEVGPYGLGASVLSFCVPAAFAFSIGYYYRKRSTNIIKIREDTKKLEAEFASALFQLGNRLGDGLPPEIAFEKVAYVMEGSRPGKFFEIVANNIRRLGMGVENAIFSPKVGAVTYYPSSVIESSMKVLVQSTRKGPEIAARALLNVSRYIKEIHRVDERLKDLMSDTISSMKSQIKFLTPVISGIVIGITSMITGIIGKLGAKLREMGEASGTGGTSLADMFGDGLPTFYFQIVVGLYVVQIVYLLTILANTIENGTDRVSEMHELGKNMINSPATYIILSVIVMILFNLIAARMNIGA